MFLYQMHKNSCDSIFSDSEYELCTLQPQNVIRLHWVFSVFPKIEVKRFMEAS